jgi:hypothetical protein
MSSLPELGKQKFPEEIQLCAVTIAVAGIILWSHVRRAADRLTETLNETRTDWDQVGATIMALGGFLAGTVVSGPPWLFLLGLGVVAFARHRAGKRWRQR